MPMFDIEDSENIELYSNKTSEDKLAKIRGVRGLKAKNNEAGLQKGSIRVEEDTVELKPNFMGIGLNLRALLRKIRGK